MMNNKKILSINFIEMILIYACCVTLGFLHNITLGIVLAAISIVSLITYMVLGKQAKNIIKSQKDKNEKNS